MKKIFVLLVCILIISGCSVKNNENVSDEEITASNIPVENMFFYGMDDESKNQIFERAESLIAQYNAWKAIDCTGGNLNMAWKDYSVSRGDVQIDMPFKIIDKDFDTMDKYRTYVEKFATSELADELINSGTIFESDGVMYREASDSIVIQAEYGTMFNLTQGDTWFEACFLTTGGDSIKGYSDTIIKFRFNSEDKKNIKISECVYGVFKEEN